MIGLKNFPSQRTQNKTKQWAKDCIDAVDGLLMDDTGSLRKSRSNKVINYNLYNNILDPEDMAKIDNPFNIPGFTSPTTPQNHPIANVKIDLLYGEYLKRDFPFTLRIGNFDAISEKEEVLKQNLNSVIVEALKKNNSQEEIEQKLQKITADNRTYQDKREITGNRILNSEMLKEDFDRKMAQGFLDLEIAGEEHFLIDIIGKKGYEDLVFERLNPLNVYTLRNGSSPFTHHADIIMVEDYMSPGQILDYYWDELKEDDIAKLEGHPKKNRKKGSNVAGDSNPYTAPIPDYYIRNAEEEVYRTEDFESGHHLSSHKAGMPVDIYGNHRVLKVFWKSYREMKLITFMDEMGNEKCRVEDRKYEINEAIGETYEKFFIGEWWEGHKIGKDSYLRMRARPVQLRERANPSRCYPPVVGGCMSVNSNKAMSLMDRMKPYQYIYNMIMERTLNAISLNYGKIMKVSLMDIPDGWKMSKWLNYVHNHKIWFYDPFKEGKKGAATGKLAGNMQQTQSTVDMELGSFIQYHIQILEYVEQQLGQIAGISPQREASISTSEKVGNVERALTQSSHITEKWFDIADYIKKEVLRVFLETAKIVYKNKDNIKKQYVTETGDTEIYDIEPGDFVESDYDIHFSNAKKDAEVLDFLKNNMHALVQNDMVDVQDMITMLTAPSVSNAARTLEKAKIERQEQAANSQKQMLEAEQASKKAEMDLEMKKHMDKLKLEYAKITADVQLKNADLQDKKTINLEELKIKAKELIVQMDELGENKRSNKANEDIRKEDIRSKERQAKHKASQSKLKAVS